MVAVAVQSIFCLEIHQNNIFFIFKKLFLRSAHQNDIKIIFSKIKKFQNLREHSLYRVSK
jgi:hypothetical protein